MSISQAILMMVDLVRLIIEATFLLESALFRREMACSLLRGEIAFMMGVLVSDNKDSIAMNSGNDRHCC